MTKEPTFEREFPEMNSARGTYNPFATHTNEVSMSGLDLLTATMHDVVVALQRGDTTSQIVVQEYLGEFSFPLLLVSDIMLSANSSKQPQGSGTACSL